MKNKHITSDKKTITTMLILKKRDKHVTHYRYTTRNMNSHSQKTDGNG